MNEFQSHVFRERTDNDFENSIINALQTVYDPEIPVNIYDLGLIYEINFDDEGSVKIIMTLTSPFCPATEQILEDIHFSIGTLTGVTSVDVDITFEPAWSPDSIPDEVKFELGII